MASTAPDRTAEGLATAGRVASEPARGRLLIINVRGFKRADALYRELAALGWKTTVLDVDEPAVLRCYALARSFRPSRARWRPRFERVAGRLARTAFAFKHKSRLYGRLIEKSGAKYDLILQGGGMFAPDWPLPTTRYAIFCDCTVKLGAGEILSGVDFASAASAAKWYALEASLYRNAGRVFSASEWVRHARVRDYGVEPERAVTVGEGSSLRAPDGAPTRRDGRTILY